MSVIAAISGGAFLPELATAIANEQFTSLEARAGGGSLFGGVGSAASKSWAQQFQLWLTTGLPAQLTEELWKPMADALEKGLGIPIDTVNRLYQEVQGMDPSQVVTFLANLTQGLQELEQVLPSFQAPGSFGVGGVGYTFDPNSIAGAAYAQLHAGIGDTIIPEMDQLKIIMQSLPLLSGADYANAVKQAGDLAVQIRQQEIEYEKEILQVQDQIRASIQSSIQTLTLAGFTQNGKTDYQGQENYLNQILGQEKQQLAVATTPQQVQAAEQAIQATIMQMYNIAASTGNQTAINAYRQWAIDQLNALEAASNAKLKSLTDPLVELNKELADLVTALDNLIKNGAGLPPGGTRDTGNPGSTRGTPPPGTHNPPPVPPPGYRVIPGEPPLPVNLFDFSTGARLDDQAVATREMVEVLHQIHEAVQAGSIDLTVIANPNNTSSPVIQRTRIARSGG